MPRKRLTPDEFTRISTRISRQAFEWLTLACNKGAYPRSQAQVITDLILEHLKPESERPKVVAPKWPVMK